MIPSINVRREEVGEAMMRALRSLGLSYSGDEFLTLVEHALIDYPRCVENYNLVADLKDVCEMGRR